MRWLFLLGLFFATASAANRIEVHGHRGARSAFPENTLPAFEHAIAVGADVLELDLAVTKDGALVVSHDPYMNPPICAGPEERPLIHSLTLNQVRQYDCGAKPNPRFPKQKAMPGTRMPTLDEVFDLAAKGDFDFNVETKIFPDAPEHTVGPAEFARLLYDVIAKHKLQGRVIVQSFDFRTLHEMKKLDPNIRLSALYEDAAKSFVAISRDAGGTPIVSPDCRLVTKERVDEAHAAGLKVVPWTANEPAEWQELIDAGVNGIITDDPAALIAWLRARP